MESNSKRRRHACEYCSGAVSDQVFSSKIDNLLVHFIMLLPIPQKRPFHSVFKPWCTENYKPGGQAPVGQEPHSAERRRCRLAGQPILKAAPGSILFILPSY